MEMNFRAFIKKYWLPAAAALCSTAVFLFWIALRVNWAGISKFLGADHNPSFLVMNLPLMICVLMGVILLLGAVLGVPVYFFTHQQGHVMAALTGAECLHLRHTPFLAFHVSGGTTDALLVEPDESCIIRCRVVGHSLDLKAGQLIDRVGGMLGLSFPAGPALETLALQAQREYKPRAVLRGSDCHLSGVENQCRDRLDRGEPPAEIARFCLDSVGAAIEGMTEALLVEYGDLPVVYAGGVMSNSLLKQRFTDRFGGHFAPPVYSADNAAGIACLCRLAVEEGAR